MTEVYSGVFMGESRGNTIHIVTSSLSGVKTRVRKKSKAFCTPYVVKERPKRRKKETIYDHLRAVEDGRVNALLKWTSGTEAPTTIHSRMTR